MHTITMNGGLRLPGADRVGLIRQLGLALLLSASVARAELVPATSAIDFGRVSTLSTPQREVVLQSRGTTPAQILEAKGSCGCVQVEVLTPQIAAGQSGRLRIVLHPLRAPARQNVWDVIVRYREGEVVREMRFAVCADVIREVTITPAMLELSVSTNVEQDIVLTDYRQKPLQIVRLETTSPVVSASLVESNAGPTHPRQYRIRLKVSSDLPQSALETLLVIHTDDKQCRRFLVPVRLRRLANAAILVSPADATLFVSPMGTDSRLFTFRDRHGRLCRIAGVECDHPGLQCHWPEGTFSVTTMRVTVRGESLQNETAQAEICVHFAEPEQCTVRIPVRIVRR